MNYSYCIDEGSTRTENSPKRWLICPMSQQDLQQQFDNAVTASKHLSERPSNDVMLQIYALYKQAVEGDINIEPPSNPFDFVSKAKYEAWEGMKGKRKEDAMQQYVDLIAELKKS